MDFWFSFITKRVKPVVCRYWYRDVAVAIKDRLGASPGARESPEKQNLAWRKHEWKSLQYLPSLKTGSLYYKNNAIPGI